MSASGPSPHLTWAELACRDKGRTCYPLDYRTDGRIRPLALAFEQIRQATGNKPIRIESAYRTPVWNAMVGGAPKSQHVFGRALDLKTPSHLSLLTFWAIVQDVARMTANIGAIGLYDWGIHVDTRPRIHGDRPVMWDLRSVKQG